MKIDKNFFLLIVGSYCSLWAALGDLDTSFNGVGYVTTTFDAGIEFGHALVEQGDGKLIAVGEARVGGVPHIGIVRYNTNGTIDTSYGTLGKTTTLVGSAAAGYAAALDSNGRLVVAGYALTGGGQRTSLLVARYTTAGALDTTFNGVGYVTKKIAVNTTDIAYGIAIQADGKIVVAGVGNNKFVIARYTSVGVLDTATFGGGAGYVTPPVGSGTQVAHGVVVQSADQYIVVAGRASDQFAFIRLDTTGTLDPVFGTGGIKLVPATSGINFANAIALQPDGKILAAGIARSGAPWYFATVRLDTFGQLDTTFNLSGIVITPVNGGSMSPYGAMAVAYDTTNSRILVAGEGGNDIGLVRYTTTGVLDSAFGSGGIVRTNVGTNDVASSLVIQTCGTIAVCGVSSDLYVVLRYLNSTTGAVNGTVFNDLNGNGIQASGEAGIAGVTVTIKQGSTLIDEPITDANGAYSKSGLTPNTYTVTATTPAGYVPTTNLTQTISVTSSACTTINFGFQQESTISGIVFVDTNGDGIKDGGEVGLAGITVTLTKPDLSTETYVTDDGTGALGVLGAYQFTGLATGTYTISINTSQAALTNYVATTVTSQIVTLPTASSSGSANFGFQLKGAVSGVVFQDENGNGIQDLTEGGITGVTVTLTSGSSSTSTTTGVGGAYTFTTVSPGAYIVSATTPSGYVPTTATSQAISVASGGSSSANFGFIAQGVISGTVFDDLDGDGIQELGEPGVVGVTVTLKSGSTTVTTTVSDSNGSYIFPSITPGTYTVEITVPSGFTPTTLTTRPVTLVSGGSVSTSFGLQANGAITGNIFNDLDGDGMKQVDEPGLAGVTVDLSDSDSTTTSVNGDYQFLNKTPGTYTVTASTPSGFVATTPTSRVVTFYSGGSASANFGFQGQGAVSGTVFNDLNANGAQDSGEGGIGGVSVALAGIGSTTTGSAGGYNFSSVPAGNYTISVTTPSGFVATTPTSRAITVPTGSSASANFGFSSNTIVSGVVFQDLNGDGTMQVNEPGLSGVALTLRNSSSTVIATTTSLAHGVYSFPALTTSENYTVTAAAPTGFNATTPTTQTVNIPSSPIANFGFQAQGTIGGTVFNDLNGDGLKAVNEPGMAGIQVTLTAPGGGTTVATTDTHGEFQFTSLTTLGTYSIAVTVPTGFVTTTATTISADLVAGQAINVIFGLKLSAQLSGIVFNDVNGNGIQDHNESGIRNAKVSFKNTSEVVIQETLTDAYGAYQIDVSSLPSGTNYLVVCDSVSGYANTTPLEVGITTGAAHLTVNFGFQAIGTLSGTVFNDNNADAYQNIGIGLNAQPVYLYNETGVTLIASTFSQANGNYTFSRDLTSEPQFFILKSTNPTGYGATELTTQPACLNPSVGVANCDFGKKECCTVSGIVFNDLNGDQVQQRNALGRPGVSLTLRNFAGNVVAKATSNAQGLYKITNIPAGIYSVQATTGSGFYCTAGSQRTVDLVSRNVCAANFGVAPVNSVVGVVWLDYSAGGHQQFNEPGIGGVTVTLTGSNGISSTTTAGNGYYAFSSLAPGPYSVTISNYTGYTTATISKTVTLTAQQSAFANFGLQLPNTITGRVFFDVSASERQGINERGKQGASIALKNAAGTTLKQTAAASDGVYAFNVVSEGNYSVVATKPARCAPVSSLTQSVTIATATGAGAANFGMQMENSVSGSVFYTSARDGTKAFEDVGMGGITITLKNAAGTTTTQTSVGDGNYLFTNLSSGTYSVTVRAPAGFYATTPLSKTVTVASGVAGAANFGFYAREYTKSALARAIQKRYCRTQRVCN